MGYYILKDEKYGGANFHHVTVDLQVYELDNLKYVRLYKSESRKIDIKDIFPLKEIILEDIHFNAPNQIKKILTEQYGSLKPNAKYNKKRKNMNKNENIKILK